MSPALHKAVEAGMIPDRGTRKLSSSSYLELCEDVMPDEVVIGVDEVGNGCVFGPLCVAAVAIPTGWRLPGVRDSKKIASEARRQALAAEIHHNCVWVTAMMQADALERFGHKNCLDQMNISVAYAVAEKVRATFPHAKIRIIYDGKVEGQVDHVERGMLVQYVPKADATQYEVSAASILAKVARDNWIHEIVKTDPIYRLYDLDANKGYGTASHTAALLAHGMTPHHRRRACETLLRSHRHGHPTTESVAAG